MEYETSCGAVVYQLRNSHLFFLVEHSMMGHAAIPKGYAKGKETEEETAVCAIREETGLEVRLDTVFRHDIWLSACGGMKRQAVFFAAQALSQGLKHQEGEAPALEWLPYERAVKAVTCDAEKDLLSHAAVYLGVRHDVFVDRRSLMLSTSGSGIWYREHIADIHSHTIVGVDDGAQTMEEAAALLRLDWEEGARVVFATPHYGIENGFAPDGNDVWYGFNKLSEAAAQTVPGMKVSFGAEWYCSEDILDRIRRREAWPMMPTDWYLVEFLEWGEHTEPADVIMRRLKNLRDNGVKTILAHPERYRAVQQDWELAKRICDLGVLLQVNAYDLFLNQKAATRDLAQWMAKEEMISFIGSDMHGTRPGKRTPRMKEGIRWLYQNVDEEYANEIVRVNAERYLGVEKLLPVQNP